MPQAVLVGSPPSLPIPGIETVGSVARAPGAPTVSLIANATLTLGAVTAIAVAPGTAATVPPVAV